jgi:hypothetical protein
LLYESKDFNTPKPHCYQIVINEHLFDRFTFRWGKKGRGWLKTSHPQLRPVWGKGVRWGLFKPDCATYERNSLADNRQSVLQPFQSFAHYRSCARLIIFLQDKISGSNPDLTCD